MKTLWNNQMRTTSRRHHLSSRSMSVRRRGTSLLELVVGAALLGVFLSGLVPMLRSVHLASRFNEQHQSANQELANQMEHLAALPAGSIDAEHLASLEPSLVAQSQLPDVQLTATASPADAGTQKITCELTWSTDTTNQTAPVRLTAWFPAGPADTDSVAAIP